MTSHAFHASCVLLPDCKMAGILVTGPAQSGKSSLALQLLESGGLLVSDDQTLVKPGSSGLIATAPEALAGLIEIHGYGIVQVPPEQIAPAATLALSVTIIPPELPLERLPEQSAQQILSVKLPHLALRPYDPASVAKIRAVLRYRLLDYSDV